MFTIQYQAVDGTHKMQDFNTTDRMKLAIHLSTFSRPIIAVYENGNVITKVAQKEMTKWPGSKSRYAKEFVSSCPA